MLKTFRIGGIHPPENKLSASSPITDLPLPEQVTILLGQHIGAPAEVQVEKGDIVRVGTLLAKAAGFVSAHIHSSVSGKVTKIESVADASGYSRPAVIIEVEGDHWESTIDRSPALITTTDLDAKGIVARINECGIVGLGGATFPTHVKLMPPPQFKSEVLIINGVECEPYLTGDHRLMLEKPEEVLVGTSLLMRAVGVSRAIIGIEDNKRDALKTLKELAPRYPGICIEPLRVQYPQGGEKQLIDALIHRQVPSGSLPVSTGAVVQNVATAFAVYEAVMKHKPLFERVVTVTGKALSAPGNFRVRIGTPITRLIAAAGGLPEETTKIISGGPMMGKALLTPEQPTTKGCSGILLMGEAEASRKPLQECFRCAKCVAVCPMGLSPYLQMKVSELALWDKAEEERIMDCIECGSCSFTCPAHRPLLDYIRLGKSRVGAILRARTTTK